MEACGRWGELRPLAAGLGDHDKAARVRGVRYVRFNKVPAMEVQVPPDKLVRLEEIKVGLDKEMKEKKRSMKWMRSM